MDNKKFKEEVAGGIGFIFGTILAYFVFIGWSVNFVTNKIDFLCIGMMTWCCCTMAIGLCSQVVLTLCERFFPKGFATMAHILIKTVNNLVEKISEED